MLEKIRVGQGVSKQIQEDGQASLKRSRVGQGVCKQIQEDGQASLKRSRVGHGVSKQCQGVPTLYCIICIICVICTICIVSSESNRLRLQATASAADLPVLTGYRMGPSNPEKKIEGA